MLNLAVIDDNRGIRVALKRLLGASGHHVDLFSSAEDFLAHEISADCLIVDVRLPGLSGFELEERLRAAGSITPIVFMTAQHEMVTRRVSAGVTRSCLPKPFDEDRLLTAISDALT
ncbi:MAG TPA: response regulator [Vicinamibacterales bacterium]|nr:response regulator [Vicinamibacterales bacterium]